jgi:hypothetical protein
MSETEKPKTLAVTQGVFADNGTSVATIQVDAQGAHLMLYGDVHRKGVGSLPEIALSATRDGKAMLQVRINGAPKHIDLADLFAVVEANKVDARDRLQANDRVAALNTCPAK